MSNERPVELPTIYVQQAPALTANEYTSLRCASVVDKSGPTPSEATLVYYPGDIGDEVEGPTTLNLISVGSVTEADDGIILENGDNLAYDPDTLKHGARVIVARSTTNDNPFFAGWIRGRHDQHADNSTVFTAEDDRILLSYIPVYGAFIRDETAGGDAELKYSATHPALMNPKGAWNCTGFDFGGTVVPVFTSTAFRGKSYVAPDTAFPPGDLPTDGTPVPWTPRRALQYMWLLANLKHAAEVLGGGAIPSNYVGTFLKPFDDLNPYLKWEWARMQNAAFDPDTGGGMQGWDVSSVDPLDRSIRPMNFQGDTVLGAITKILKEAGTHVLLCRCLAVTGGINTVATSEIWFGPTGASAQYSGNYTYLSCQVNGAADFDYTDHGGDLIDFSLEEDSRNVSGIHLLEGAPIKVETRVQWTGYTGDSTIVPAWDDSEEIAFLHCLWGGAPGPAERYYAKAPNVFGNTTVAEFVTANGTNGYPKAMAGSPEALAIARENFPTVYRAWRLNMLSPLAEAFANAGVTEYLRNSRPVLGSQLQYYVSETALSASGDKRSMTLLPIRIEVERVLSLSDMLSRTGTPEYIQVTRDVKVRVTATEEGDCLLWFDGLAEGNDSNIECIYCGSLFHVSQYNTMQINGVVITVPGYPTKRMRANLAMPTEYRTRAFCYVEPDSTKTLSMAWLDEALGKSLDATTGLYLSPVRLLSYTDAGDSFRSERQYKSFPAAVPKYYGGTSGTEGEGDSTGLTRWVPPGNEYPNAFYASSRELIRRKNIRRRSSWVLAGIPDGGVSTSNYRAGQWLRHIELNDRLSGKSSYYTVDGSIGEVEYDFLKQRTTVGGVVSQEYV